MAGADQANISNQVLPLISGRNKLLLRIASALVMAPLAIAAAYYGEFVFLVFWVLAALGVLWEWDGLVCAHDKNTVYATGAATIAATAVLWGMNRMIPSVILMALGLIGVATIASKIRRAWCVGGLAYASALMLAPIVLRQDPVLGFWAITYLFAVVWATDIAAYVAGRAIGGPKLARYVSPNKTWAGAIGGTTAGVAGGVALAMFAGIGHLIPLGMLALVLSLCSQVGDLLESAIKRRFNAKDSSWFIPGHGGLMDRLDGFWAASVVAVLIAIVRGGIETPAQGLLVW